MIGVAVLVGLNVSLKDLGAVAEVGLVALGYASGPIIIARPLPSLPAVGVVAASLVLTALFYAPLAVPQLPRAMPSGTVLLAVLTLAVVCTALAFLIFFALSQLTLIATGLISQVGWRSFQSSDTVPPRPPEDGPFPPRMPVPRTAISTSS